MGGWCARREQCPAYTAPGRKPVERLCVPGRDGWRLVDVTPLRSVLRCIFTGREAEPQMEDLA